MFFMTAAWNHVSKAECQNIKIRYMKLGVRECDMFYYVNRHYLKKLTVKGFVQDENEKTCYCLFEPLEQMSSSIY